MNLAIASMYPQLAWLSVYTNTFLVDVSAHQRSTGISIALNFGINFGMRRTKHLICVSCYANQAAL